MTDNGFKHFIAALQLQKAGIKPRRVRKKKEPPPKKPPIPRQKPAAKPEPLPNRTPAPKARVVIPYTIPPDSPYLVPPLDEDYTGSMCLLHALTPKYPTYAEVLVDADKFDELAQWRWGLVHFGKAKGPYVVRRGDSAFLHRVVMDAPKGMLVDHRYRNPLDNRTKTLRVCTYAQNNLNRRPRHVQTSRFRGVYWDEPRRKWILMCGRRGQPKHYAAFSTEEEAATAYNAYALATYGEFAYLNPV